MLLHWTLWNTSWSHRNWLRLFMWSCEVLKDKEISCTQFRVARPLERSSYTKLRHGPVIHLLSPLILESAHLRLSKQSVIISRRASRYIFAKIHHPVSRLCHVRHLRSLHILLLSKSFLGKRFSGCEGYTMVQNWFLTQSATSSWTQLMMHNGHEYT